MRTKTPVLQKKPERPQQVPITFAKNEKHLLTVLDQNLKSTVFSSRSGWVKQKIREEFLV